MRLILSLGIKDPLVRVLVWLTGCASLSIVAFVAGLVAVVLLATCYAASIKVKLSVQ